MMKIHSKEMSISKNKPKRMIKPMYARRPYYAEVLMKKFKLKEMLNKMIKSKVLKKWEQKPVKLVQKEKIKRPYRVYNPITTSTFESNS